MSEDELKRKFHETHGLDGKNTLSSAGKLAETANYDGNRDQSNNILSHNIACGNGLQKEFHSIDGFVERSHEEVLNIKIPKSLLENNSKEIPSNNEILENGTITNGNKTEKIKPILWTQVFAAISFAAVYLASGVIISFTGVMLPSIMDLESDDLILSVSEASLFSSVANFGAIFGSILSSVMMTRLGQRTSLIVLLPFGMIFWIVMAKSKAFWLVLLSRIGLGIVFGASAGCSSNYIVEIAHTSMRGRLSALCDMFRQIGCILTFFVGSTGLTWRTVSLACGLTTMTCPLIGIIFLPNSPRWLATQGRLEEANKSLIFFRGKNYDVKTELSDISEQLERTSKGCRIQDQLKMLLEPSLAKRFLILAFMLFAINFTGIIAIITYCVSIFESANVSIDSYLSSVIVTCCGLIGILCYCIFADKLKRRPLFTISTCLTGVCMVALGYFFYAKDIQGDTSYIAWLPIVCICIFFLFINITLPVLFLLRIELLPTSVRSVAIGLLFCIFFGGSFIAAISFPYTVDSIGSCWTFWIYGAVNFVVVFILYIAVPETYGKSLEEIGELNR